MFCFWLGVQGVVVVQNEMITGVLQPTSIYRGVDGVGIDTKFAVIEGEPKISINRIIDISSFPPLSPNPVAKAVTPYYEINSPEIIYAGQGETYFVICVPLPVGASTENLAVFTLADNKHTNVFSPSPTDEPVEEGYTWFSGSATYVPTTNEVIFSAKTFGRRPLRFTIVSGVYGQ